MSFFPQLFFLGVVQNLQAAQAQAQAAAQAAAQAQAQAAAQAAARVDPNVGVLAINKTVGEAIAASNRFFERALDQSMSRSVSRPEDGASLFTGAGAPAPALGAPTERSDFPPRLAEAMQVLFIQGFRPEIKLHPLSSFRG